MYSDLCTFWCVYKSFSLLMHTINKDTRRLSTDANMTLFALVFEEFQLMLNLQPYTNTFGQCSSLSNLYFPPCDTEMCYAVEAEDKAISINTHLWIFSSLRGLMSRASVVFPIVSLNIASVPLTVEAHFRLFILL